MVPKQEDLLTLREAAKVFGVDFRRMKRCVYDGLKAQDGQVIKIETWVTIKGVCTTRDAVLEFQEKLNIHRRMR